MIVLLKFLTIDIPTSIKSVLGGAMYCDFLSFDLRTLDREEDKSDFTQKEEQDLRQFCLGIAGTQS